MTKLNQIELLWYVRDWKNRNLSKSVQDALRRWDVRKETKDAVPETVIFHTLHKDEIQEDKIQELEVEFENSIIPKHFKIRGTL